MSKKIVASAALILVLGAGSSFAEVRRPPVDARAPATTGSLRGPAGTGSAFEAPDRAPSLFGSQRSSFNADSARARHYER